MQISVGLTHLVNEVYELLDKEGIDHGSMKFTQLPKPQQGP
jgi:hypothetical protein